MRSKPDDFVPPYGAYSAHPTDTREFVMSMVGVQSPSDGSGVPLLNQLLGLMGADEPHRPRAVELTWHIDADGYRNDVVLPYWQTPQDMAGFFERPDVTAWRTRHLTGRVGWWRESVVAPVTSLDGGYSIANPRYGVSRHSDVQVEQFHAYMGSMRDRVPDYLSGARDGDEVGLTRRADVESRGRHLRMSELPDNLCFIRGAWGWMEAEADEQKAFQEQMLPVLIDGAEYLRDNPEESSCISMRQTQAVHLGYDNNVQVEVLGWFRTLQDLERWTKFHPRHLAIMKNILGYMERFNFQPKLNLGHEVAVVPKSGVFAEYNNCHPRTGFLPFFDSEAVSYSAA